MAGCGVDNVSRLATVGAMGGTALGRSGKERLALSEEELSAVDGSRELGRHRAPSAAWNLERAIRACASGNKMRGRRPGRLRNVRARTQAQTYEGPQEGQRPLARRQKRLSVVAAFQP